jgi:hypothetical protein
MASPVGEREARLERPLRVGLVLLPAALALTAIVLTACGGGGADDGAKVEASLQDYLNTIDPEACLGSGICRQGAFPFGAGAPQVKENSCKNLHTGPARLPEGFAGWSCVVGSGTGRAHCLWPSL